jgi:hypothetical protein
VNREVEIKALQVAAAIAAAVSKTGGPVGLGATAVAALLGTVATVMAASGESADDILKRIRQPGPLKSWDQIKAEADEAETVSAKLKPSGGQQ